MRISDWSSDVCSSDLLAVVGPSQAGEIGGVRLRRRGERRRRFDDEAIAPRRDERKAIVARRKVVDGAAGVGDALARDHARRIGRDAVVAEHRRSEEHTSELQSLMRISYAVFCLKKKHKNK